MGTEALTHEQREHLELERDRLALDVAEGKAREDELRAVESRLDALQRASDRSVAAAREGERRRQNEQEAAEAAKRKSDLRSLEGLLRKRRKTAQAIEESLGALVEALADDRSLSQGIANLCLTLDLRMNYEQRQMAYWRVLARLAEALSPSEVQLPLVVLSDKRYREQALPELLAPMLTVPKEA
jgi:hypothetical protein